MKAYDYVEKLLNDCEGDQKEFGIRLKNSLVRLTTRYNTNGQEKIITKIINRDIFAYVFVEETSTKHRITPYPETWLALTPSQVNRVIQNPGKKITISLGERYGAIDIDCFWVVKQESDESVANIDRVQEQSVAAHQNNQRNTSTLNEPISKEKMYSQLSLSDEERTSFIKILQGGVVSERNEFITESADKHMAALKKQNPPNEVTRYLIIKTLHTLHKPLYEGLGIKQPNLDSYETKDREVRRKLKDKTKK